MALNFNDCHAKIRQVDAQATIGTGVVVQVSVPLGSCLTGNTKTSCLMVPQWFCSTLNKSV